VLADRLSGASVYGRVHPSGVVQRINGPRLLGVGVMDRTRLSVWRVRGGARVRVGCVGVWVCGGESGVQTGGGAWKAGRPDGRSAE